MRNIISRIKNLLTYLFLLVTFNTAIYAESLLVSIITESTKSKPVEYALGKLTKTLDNNGIRFEIVDSISKAEGDNLFVIGFAADDGETVKLLNDRNQQIPNIDESLTIWKTTVNGKQTWVVTGFDDRGLMYAILDIAERISLSEDNTDPFKYIEEISETPYVPTRAISMYTMNRNYWESRFYDEDYWKRYMDELAKNRFNSIVLIFGYENGGFLAPCYPYFFNLEGFPDVKMDRLTEKEQAKNLSALNRMIDLAHERGLEFKVAIWDHVYRRGIQSGGIKDSIDQQIRDHKVYGVNSKNLFDYTTAAFAKFIQLVPKLDGIQFRMHNESGLKPGEEMEKFWTEMFKMIKATTPNLRIDLRAKELPDEIINIAAELELNFTIATKYWMEQMGLPFHPTHINRQNQHDRRHGYADMLQYPKKYNIHWRMWTGGTQRILLWGNPDYVRRFAESTHLYDGNGFEINEPLATKMDGQPHYLEPFNLLNPEYIYYDYEFERYWYYFQTFGRLSYNPNTSEQLLLRGFQKRFGNKVGPLIQKALHKASYILPMINSACAPYSVFPTTRGWVAKQRLGELSDYAKAEGSDIQQFASFDEEAQVLIGELETAKRLPSQTSIWFAEISDTINKIIDKVKVLNEHRNNKEIISTLTDLSILSNLAMYHSYRIPAAVSYRVFERTSVSNALDDAIKYESSAIEAWQKIVEAAGNVYTADLMMGSRGTTKYNIIHRLSGHWKDELPYMQKGLEDLKSSRNTLSDKVKVLSSANYKVAESFSNKELFRITHAPVATSPIKKDIKIKANIESKNKIKWVRLRYRSINQQEDYKILMMKENDENGLFECTVYNNEINPKYDFMYFIEVMDIEGNGYIYPDLDIETPYIFTKLLR